MSRSQSVVRPSRRVARNLLLPVTLLALGGCGMTLDIAGVEKSIRDGVVQQLGLAMTSVTCPQESRAAKAGDTFECTGKPEIGGSLSVEVTQKDDQGNIAWKVLKSTGLFDMQEAEAAVKKALADQFGTEVELSCGDRWRVGGTGDTFGARARMPTGRFRR